MRERMSVWSATAIGVGAMVGAGLFALLGQAALRAGTNVPLVFAIGGVVAILTGYSYAKLAARFPGSGGINIYFRESFGKSVLSGTMSILYYITIMVASAMIAQSFGKYAVALAGLDDNGIAPQAFAVGIILLLTVVNSIGTGHAGRLETLLVVFKLVVLGILAVAGAAQMHSSLHVSYTPMPPSQLLSVVGLVFFAYAGFGTITNASGSVADPSKTIPRSIYGAIIFVTGLYVALSIIVLGSVDPGGLAAHADTVIADAAKPLLGRAGFYAVVLAALAATASAINSNFFSALQTLTGLGEHQQLPAFFNRLIWRNGTQGFFWSVGGVIILSVTFDLSATANMGSATFLMTYLGVQISHMRLRRQTGGSAFLIGLGSLSIAIVLISFLWQISLTQPVSIIMIASFVGFAACAEWLCLRLQPA